MKIAACNCRYGCQPSIPCKNFLAMFVWLLRRGATGSGGVRFRPEADLSIIVIPDLIRDDINKKALSYMIRLCQPSSRLFQYVDNSARSPACEPGAPLSPRAAKPAAAQG